MLGKIDPRTRSPLNAVGAFFSFVIILLLLGWIFDWSISFYGVLTAVGILLLTVLICIASLKLPAKFPERYETAYFKIPRSLLWILTILAVVTSLAFILIVIVEEEPVVGIIYICWSILIFFYHRSRVNFLKKSGVDWDGLISRLPGYDEDGETV